METTRQKKATIYLRAYSTNATFWAHSTHHTKIMDNFITGLYNSARVLGHCSIVDKASANAPMDPCSQPGGGNNL